MITLENADYRAVMANPYFRELADMWAAPEPPDRDVELDLMRRHGMEPS